MDLYELGKQYLDISKELRIKIADLNENSKKLKGNELICLTPYQQHLPRV
ncbi:MAG: hypothetical protein Q4B04_01060 [bacterium]|nr:hypothetical protein [bacterium]